MTVNQEDLKRDKLLTVPLSETEMNQVKQYADKLGMPITVFIRLLIQNWADKVTFEKK